LRARRKGARIDRIGQRKTETNVDRCAAIQVRKKK
jgi:hypothetical protein